MTDTTAAILAHPTCTPEELCHLLRFGKLAAYRALKAGGIPSFRVGNKYHIPTSWLRDKLGLPQAAE
jgi:excisionase family DNA binding protein